jgi:hypothetical protein
MKTVESWFTAEALTDQYDSTMDSRGDQVIQHQELVIVTTEKDARTRYLRLGLEGDMVGGVGEGEDAKGSESCPQVCLDALRRTSCKSPVLPITCTRVLYRGLVDFIKDERIPELRITLESVQAKEGGRE